LQLPVHKISISIISLIGYNFESSLHHSTFLEESQLMNENQNEIDEIDDQDDTDSSDEENIKLYIGQSFKTWEEAEEHLNNYGKKKEF
ncbi:17930_t:CDS:1, partial [Gigaspora rosea]